MWKFNFNTLKAVIMFKINLMSFKLNSKICLIGNSGNNLFLKNIIGLVSAIKFKLEFLSKLS
jgi:hypothetical protein